MSEDALPYSGNHRRSVSFDERALLIEGKRELLISGEIHYPRVPEEEWERVLDITKAAGINCIATYVFWNLHEQRKDCYDFSDGKNLSRFLSLCRDQRPLRDLACRPLLLRGMELRWFSVLAAG